VDKISDEELWRTHERGREQLVAFARPKLIAQLKNRGASAAEIKDAENALNPETLTIGFARRFATYKRGTLLLRNSERLRRIISDKTRPVQFIFAGKAHPKDEPGKEFIRRIIHFARDPEIRHRVIFLENYDISVARSMVRGVDVWLNTPRRPLEACGTSGMKAALNGALNLSILDGWWCEGYKPNLGWAIGKGEEYDNEELQDDIEANALYNILEQKVIPMFYDEGPSGVPHEWVSYMKESMKALGPVFSTNRMTFEYLEKFYLPAELGSEEMKRDNYQAARKSALWKEKIRKNWTQVQFIEVLSENGEGHQVEDFHRVSVKIKIGRLSPDDLTVELYYGRLNEKREIMEGETLELEFSALEKDGIAIFQGQIPLKSSGRFGFRARALPNKNKMSGYHPVSVLWE
jgi:starch phosphorylase